MKPIKFYNEFGHDLYTISVIKFFNCFSLLMFSLFEHDSCLFGVH